MSTETRVAQAAAFDLIIVECPECGHSMFLFHTEPEVAGNGDVATYTCACGQERQHRQTLR